MILQILENRWIVALVALLEVLLKGGLVQYSVLKEFHGECNTRIAVGDGGQRG